MPAPPKDDINCDPYRTALENRANLLERVDQLWTPTGHFAICNQLPRTWRFELPGTGQI